MSQSFSQIAALWKESKRPYIKQSSYAIYVSLLNLYIVPAFRENSRPREEDVQAFADRMLADGHALKTVKDTLLVLRMVLRFGTKLGAWPAVDSGVHFPTQAQREKAPAVLSVDQQKRLLGHLRQNPSSKNLGILICLYAGLRIGEICALQWQDLDLGCGVLHVRKTVQRISFADDGVRQNYLLVGPPKTSSSLRDIPLPGTLTRMLRPLRRQVSPQYYVVSGSAKPYEPRYYRAYYRRLLARLGIPPVRFHALRHSFATRCIQSRCDYKTVSAILGHSSISTTMDLYVHPGLEDKKRAIEKMARVFVDD